MSLDEIAAAIASGGTFAGMSGTDTSLVTAKPANLSPTMNTDNSTGFLGWLGSTVQAAATGWGYGQATQSIAGRAPGIGQFANPVQQTTGAAGQPGTTPATATVWSQIMPYVLIAAGLLGLAVVLRLFRK